MDISQLRSNNASSNPQEDTNVIVDPNVAKARGKNIDGNELRDFGNGMKELDPIASGFVVPKQDPGKDDIDRALDLFDAAMERKRKEVIEFNEAIDASGGELTEAEFREMRGEGFITEALKDAPLPSNDNKDEDIDGLEEEADDTSIDSESTGEDDIEKELELFDSVEDGGIEEGSTNEIKFKTQPVIDTPEVNISAVSNESIVTGASNNEESKKEEDKDELSKEDKDLAALEDDTVVPNDFTDKLKEAIQKAMLPKTKAIDISSFTISKKPASVSTIVSKSHVPSGAISWPMMDSKFPLKIKAFNATDLATLSRLNDNNDTREMYRLVYDHIIAPKGGSFVQWSKCFNVKDVNHLWMAIYAASYSKSNYLPFSCSKCGNVMVTDDITIDEMIQFKSDEDKEEFNRIKNLPITDEMANLEVATVVPINTEYAVAIKPASLYESVFIPLLLDNKFKDDYQDVIGLIPYIDTFYLINSDTQQLIPMDIKEFPRNEVKTAKAKIIQLAKVIRSLTSDEFNILVGYLAPFRMYEDEAVQYKLPGITCTECGTEIPEEVNMAAQLVFTRHQLAIYGVL